MLAFLAGCDVLGKGTQEALYKLPKGKRMLVFVDVHVGAEVPVDVPAELGQKIADHLYQYKAADSFVSQQKLVSLRANGEAFSKMSIEDVARETGADVVVFVELLEFYAKAVSEGQLTAGQAQGFVKVVDAHGNRLWPPGAETPGANVGATVPEKLAEEQELTKVRRTLLLDLAARVGRAFHDYDKEDKDAAR